MSTTYPLGERSRRVTRIAAIFVLAVVILAVVGQTTGVRIIGPLFQSYPRINFGEAAGLVGLGVGLLGLARGREVTAFVGAGVALVAGVANSTSPGISVAATLSMVASGLGIAALAARRRVRAGTIAAGAAGMTVGVVCAALLFTYTTDVLSGLRINSLTALAIPAAVSLFAVGVALVALAWRRQGEPAAPFPDWVPWAAGGAVLVTTVLLWRALTIDEHDRSAGLLRTQATIAHHEVLTQLQASSQLLRQLGVGTGDSTGPPLSSNAAVRRLVAEVPALEVVGWIDRMLRVRRVLSIRSRSAPDSTELERMLNRTGIGISQAVMPDRPVVRVAERADGSPRLLIAASRCGERGCGPPVIGVLQPELLLRPAMAVAVPGYDVAVRADGRLLYASSTPGSRQETRLGRVQRAVLGPRWEVEVWPMQGTMVLFESDLPQVVGGLGLVVSALLAATLRLVQTGFASARRAERARVALALESATDGLWELDLATGESTRSHAVWERLGYDGTTIAGDTSAEQWRNLIHPDDRSRIAQRLDEYVAGRIPQFEIEYRIQARDGGWHWIVERGRVVERDVRGRALRVLGICADVTERRRADQALADSERRFRVVFDSGLQFESLLDLEGRLLESNRTSLEFAGVGLEDVRGKYLWDTPWWAGSAAGRLRLEQACVEAARGNTIRYEDEVLGSKDRRALVDFSLKPIRDAEGRVTQMLAEGRDITERKRAEDAMREMDTLSTMGRVAARVAHEINNPLAGIENAFLLVKDAVSPSHPYYAYVGAIEREIRRIASVTRQLYETYRPASEGMGDSSVPLVISDAVRMLEQVNKNAQVRIEVDASGAPGVLPVPSALLRQAVYNLVQNAVEASPPGETVTVRAWSDGQLFWLSIRDRGAGVPPEMRERIFEPFVTTKRHLKTAGMGLGLSLVRRSVLALGGRIEIHDPEGGGAEFRIRLSVADQPSRNGT